VEKVIAHKGPAPDQRSALERTPPAVTPPSCCLDKHRQDEGGSQWNLYLYPKGKSGYDRPGQETSTSHSMTFGERIRQLRKAKNLNQSELADKVGINFTYLSKIENDKVASSEFPSEETIKKLAKALGADADELLLMAKKVPDSIKKRVIERPDAFRK